MENKLHSNIKILIVDDISTMRRITKNLLHDLGYSNTLEAGDIETAFTMLQEDDFDFLVSDWKIPGTAGIELLKNVRADEELKTLPVLIVTAEAKKEARGT